MRPEELKLPFSWETPCTCIDDRVWYVSECSTAGFAFPGWSDSQLFGNSQPVCIEYCSGNGAWIAEKARLNPDLNWVAVEKKWARVRKIWSKIKNEQLNNLIVLWGEAAYSTRFFFPENSIKEIFINFPDPWPKRRHAKNRLIEPSFVADLHRILEKNASLTFVTDDPAYSKWFLSVLQADRGFCSYFPHPFYSTEQADYGSSYFEQLWRSKRTRDPLPSIHQTGHP